MQYAHTDQKLEAIGQRIAKDININHGYYGREIYTRDRVIFYNLEKAVYLAVINDDKGGLYVSPRVFTIPNKIYGYDYIGYFKYTELK